MAAILFTATVEHKCSNRACKDTIEVGEKAIKNTDKSQVHYYHERCWPPGRGKPEGG